MTARLPVDGGDANNWGALLNEFLQVAHNSGGSNKNSASVVNVTDDAYGATGDGSTDDASAIQAAIDACNSGGGGTVYFPAGTYLCGSTITLYRGVRLLGAGIGGDIFSATDAGLPYSGTVLRLKNSVNDDLIRTENFSSLTGLTSPSTYDVPYRFTVQDMVLDGNKAGNSSGWALRIYGRAYHVDHVVIQNGASGGVWSEGPGGGYDMESFWANFRIGDCNGDGLHFLGPHDSQFVNGVVARCTGANIYEGPNGGNLQFTNVHSWGSDGTYLWDMQCPDTHHVNCVSDGIGSGAAIRLAAGRVSWRGGSIYGTNTQGEVAVQIGNGDGGTYNVTGCAFETTWWNWALGAILLRYMRDGGLSAAHNWFSKFIYASTSSRLVADIGKTTVSGAQAGNTATLTVADTTLFPSSGSLYVAAAGSGGSGISTINYTGKTSTTFTGCTNGNSSQTIPDGTIIFQPIGSFTNSNTETWWFESADGLATFGIQTGFQGSQQGFFDGRNVVFSGTFASNQGVKLGFTGGSSASHIYSGTGVPSNSSGSDGDFYLRQDTPGTANQRLYVKSSGSWTGIL